MDVGAAAREPSEAPDAVVELCADAVAAAASLGAGLVGNPANGALRARLVDPGDPLDADGLHRLLQLVVHRRVTQRVAVAVGLLDPSVASDWAGLGAEAAALGGAGEGPVVLGGRLWDPRDTAALAGTTVTDAAVAPLLGLLPVDGPLDAAQLGVADLGAVHEALLARVPEVDPAHGVFRLQLGDGSARTAAGAHYTPAAVVEEVLDHVLEPVVEDVLRTTPVDRAAGALLALRVCDPSCGAGAFLVAVGRRLAEHVAEARHRNGEVLPFTVARLEALHDVVTRCLHGADLDPVAVGLAEVGLWLAVRDPNLTPARLSPRFVVGDALAGARLEDLEVDLPAQLLRARPGESSAASAAMRRADASRRGAPVTLSADPARLVELADAWSAVAVAPREEATAAALVHRFHDLREGLDDPAEAPGPDRPCVHWELAFPGLAAQEGPGLFDLVVGNPPYLRGRDHGREDGRGRALQTLRHSACTGSTWNLWVPFVLLAARLARRRSALVVQSSVLGAQFAGRLHETLLDTAGVVACLDWSAVPELFPDADVQVACLVVTPEPAALTSFHRYGDGLEVVALAEVAEQDLRRLPAGHWTLPTAGLPAAETACFLDPPQRLADVAEIRDGMEQNAAYAVRDLVHEATGAEGEVRLLPTGLLDPHRDLWGARSVRFLGTRWDRPVVDLSALGEAGQDAMVSQATSAKVAVAGLATRIEAVVDEGTALVSKSAYVVRPNGEDVCPFALALVLNAAVTNRLHDAVFGAQGFGAGSSNYRPRTLGALPVPPSSALGPDDGTPAGLLSRLGRGLHEAARRGRDLAQLEAEANVAVRRGLGLPVVHTGS